jgi:tetratricopeptide (TPR) repeat protein
MTGFYQRRGQYEDAVDILEQYWSSSDPMTISQVTIKLADDQKCPKELIERVEKVLNNAREKFSNAAVLTLTFADIRTFQERYDEAEAYYREVLEKTPGHSIAMNNLAVLLALQGKKLDEALSLIEKAIEISGPLAAMLDSRACVYIARGEADKALEDAKEAVTDAPSAERLFHQAQALQLAKQEYAAASTMQRALNAGLTRETLQPPERKYFDQMQELSRKLGVQEEKK